MASRAPAEAATSRRASPPAKSGRYRSSIRLYTRSRTTSGICRSVYVWYSAYGL